MTPAHRKILFRLSGTTSPINPSPEEQPLFEELYSNSYLSYVYKANEDGYILSRKGRDEVTVHRQRDKL
jgi:hypothetical protein